MPGSLLYCRRLVLPAVKHADRQGEGVNGSLPVCFLSSIRNRSVSLGKYLTTRPSERNGRRTSLACFDSTPQHPWPQDWANTVDRRSTGVVASASASEAAASDTAAPPPAQPVTVLFRLYEEEGTILNSFVEFDIGSEDQLGRVLQLLGWTAAVNMKTGQVVHSLGDLQPNGWYDRLEHSLDTKRVQRHVRIQPHEEHTVAIPLSQVFRNRIPGLEDRPDLRVVFKDPEQHKRWLAAQSELGEQEPSASPNVIDQLLRISDSTRLFDWEAVALGSSDVVLAIYKENASTTWIEELAQQARTAENLANSRRDDRCAAFWGKIVRPVLCVGGFEGGEKNQEALLKYAFQRGVQILVRKVNDEMELPFQLEDTQWGVRKRRS